MRELSDAERAAIYDILVECCGASELAREKFLAYMLHVPENGGQEFRFMGWLGFGGKLYSNSQGVYVDCYREHKTPIVAFAIKVANERIRAALAARDETRGPVYEVERDRHGLMYSGPLEVGECVRVVVVRDTPVEVIGEGERDG